MSKRKSVRAVSEDQLATPAKRSALEHVKRSAQQSTPDRKKVGRYEQYDGFSCEDIRTKLKETGEDPGPVNEGNRDLYIRLLLKREEQRATPTANKTPDVFSKTLDTPRSHSGTPSLAGRSASRGKKDNKLSLIIKGVVPAVFTPFDEDGEIVLPRLQQYADHLIANKIEYIFVNGTTGEGLSMTIEERKILLREWLKVSRGRLGIISQVGGENLKGSCELAADAEEAGAVAIAVVAPSYYKPQTIEALVQYLAAVGRSASNTPLYYYHIPSMNGVDFSVPELLDQAVNSIPTFRGIKYSSTDLCQFSRCVSHSGGKLTTLYGCDEQLLGALAMGGDGAVGSTYNYCCQMVHHMISSYQRGDMSTALLEQRRLQSTVTVLKKYGCGVTVGKVIMKMIGIDCGPPRLPLLPLPEDICRQLQTELESIGFFGWSK